MTVDHQMEFKRYKTTYSFDARNDKELSVSVGDFVDVKRKANGDWPNEQRWMVGTNKRTRKSGEVPGNYLAFVELVPCQSESPPVPVRGHAHSMRSSTKVPPKPKPRPASVYKGGQKAPPVASRVKKPENSLQSSVATPPAVAGRRTGSDVEVEPSVPPRPPRLMKMGSPLPPVAPRRHTAADVIPFQVGNREPSRSDSGVDLPLPVAPPVAPRRRVDTSLSDTSETPVFSPATESSRQAPQKSNPLVQQNAYGDGGNAGNGSVDSTADHDLFEAHFPKPTYCKHCKTVY